MCREYMTACIAPAWDNATYRQLFPAQELLDERRSGQTRIHQNRLHRSFWCQRAQTPAGRETPASDPSHAIQACLSAPKRASASERLCLYLLCEDIAMILSFEEGICKLILVNYAILHNIIRLSHTAVAVLGPCVRSEKQQVSTLKVQNAVVQHYCCTLWMLLLRSLNNSSRAYTSSTLTAQAEAVRGTLQPASRGFNFLTVSLRS